MSSTAQVLSELLSWVVLLLVMVLLTPQAYLNYQHQSTEGQSTAMLYLFVAGSIIPAAYYMFLSEPVALTLSWLGFCVVGIFVICQVPYYQQPSTADKAAAGSEPQRLSQRRRRFVYNFVAFAVVSALLVVLFYFLFIVASPSASFAWLPSAVGYVLPTGLTILGYVMQMRLIVATKDASGISPGFIVLDLTACSCSIVSVALDHWDGAAVAPFFVIIACQLVMAALHYAVYPPKSPHTAKQQPQHEQHIEMGGSVHDDDDDDDDDGAEADDAADADEDEEDEADEAAENDEEDVESGLHERSGAGHVQLDTSLHSTDDDEQDVDSDIRSTNRPDEEGDT